MPRAELNPQLACHFSLRQHAATSKQEMCTLSDRVLEWCLPLQRIQVHWHNKWPTAASTWNNAPVQKDLYTQKLMCLVDTAKTCMHTHSCTPLSRVKYSIGVYHPTSRQGATSKQERCTLSDRGLGWFLWQQQESAYALIEWENLSWTLWVTNRHLSSCQQMQSFPSIERDHPCEPHPFLLIFRLAFMSWYSFPFFQYCFCNHWMLPLII